MLSAEATVVIDRAPRQILEWVLDIDRYRQADTKIGLVVEHPHLDENGRGRLRYRGRLRGLPTPVDTNEVRLDRWSGLTFTGAPEVWTRRLVGFEGTFRCEPVDGGTRVTHRETFDFHPALVRRLAEAFLGRWLPGQVAAEMDRVKEMIEAPAPDERGLRAGRSR